MSNDREIYIKALEEFKASMVSYRQAEFGSAKREQLRAKINQSKINVEKIVRRAGVAKLMTISPPPAIGGYQYNNVNPFNVIFDAPYGVSVIADIIDTIDEAIGVIKNDENFTLEITRPKNPTSASKRSDKKSVFVVHGHDHHAKEEISRFLEKIGLTAIVLHEQANRGLTIIEKFEKFANTHYAVVLITPDDFGNSVKDTEPKLRARQNVIFELGYFFGKLGRHQVCALIKGEVERPSDSDGILYLPLDSEGAWKLPFVKELKSAGLEFDSNKVFE